MQCLLLYPKSMSTIERPIFELPYGFALVPRDEIDVKDILYIRNNPDDSYEDDLALWESCRDRSLEIVGIGTTDGPKLVAAGFLGGDMRRAILHDITEHPDYRHEGLDRLIVEQLVRAADERRVQRVLTDEVSDPYLHSTYKKLGFIGLGSLLYRDYPHK